MATPVSVGLQSGDEFAAPIRDRIRAGQADRRKYETTWQSNRAFASGQHHLQVDRFNRTLFLPDAAKKLDARGQLYSVDIINERRQRLLGEFAADDSRPELLLVDDDSGRINQDFQEQINRAIGYGWDHEWMGDEVVAQLWQHLLDDGTAAIQCCFDPTVGPVKQEHVPFYQGQPVQDKAQATELFANGPNPEVQMRTMHVGRITWRLLAGPNLIVPAGITHESGFPWICVVRPVLLDKVLEQYGDVAASLKEDTNIGSTALLSLQDSDRSGNAPAKLRGHVWLYEYHELPTRRFEQGRVVILGGDKMVPLEVEPQLRYQAPDKTWRTGIHIFHWWRVTGRFWGRALVEPMKDIQRGYNKRQTQLDQLIDRGMPYVIGARDNLPKRLGLPLELLPIKDGTRPPTPVAGINPGDWFFKDLDQKINDLDHASGVGQSALGENPSNAQTYGQLALLHDQETGKRTATRKAYQSGITRLIEDSVYDMRKWWGHDKQILLDAEEDRVDAEVFNATRIPDFFIVRAAPGSAKPRSQGAEIQKIESIWQAALGCGAVVADPHRWVQWYRDSLEAGQALALPEAPNDEHEHKAELENRLLAQGHMVEVAYYDPPQVHIPEHREAQVEAEMANDMQAVAAFEHHIQAHLAMATQVAQQQAAHEAPQLAADAIAQQQQQQPAPSQTPTGGQ
jgi:hypothetical protein